MKQIREKRKSQIEDLDNRAAIDFYHRLGHMKISVIDDDRSVLNIVDLYLSKNSQYNVQVFDDETVYLDRFKRDFYDDILIIDLNLNYIHGVYIAEFVREFPGGQIPILFISSDASTNETLLKKQLSSYNISFLKKPFGKKELLEKISEMTTLQGQELKSA